jgi:UDP-N-acetylglucosamine 2-epimerase (non-hydrolysing)/GDP/UDP-N,N'-diacetylbacillosamine 2-epimerase (hydrolysing)
MPKRRICVVTGSRAEYGLLFWVMKEIQSDPELELQVIATGMHLSPEFGLTYKLIEKDGLTIDARVEMLLSSDTPAGVTKSMGMGMIGFADALNSLRPDIIVLLGDRFEILAAATAAMMARIPVAHISGGEVTEGAIDDSIRHAITKMAHYHFVATETYRQRVIRMGEQPERVLNVGDPALDSIVRLPLLSRAQLEAELKFRLAQPTFLVTYHPATLGSISPEQAMSELLVALDQFTSAKVIFSKPNADAGGRVLSRMIDEYAARQGDRVFVTASLGQLRYLSAIKHCDVVVGNSSSGIVEAPPLKKATVNIGERQRGRLKATSIIDCPEESNAIVRALRLALSDAFQQTLPGTESLYGNCNASTRIVSFLKHIGDSEPKRFYDAIDEVETIIGTRVGGDFEVNAKAFAAPVAAPLPALSKPYVCWLDTGRSALHVALCDILRRGGGRTAYLPVYCCESVLAPFQRLGFDVHFYSMGEDLATPSSMPDPLDGSTFLYIHYFGARNQAVAEWLNTARQRTNCFVIEDCVQASLSTGVGHDGDYVVTSYRKLAPQVDGALLGSNTPVESELIDPDEAFVSQKLIGKLLRHATQREDLFLPLLERSEQRLNGTCAPRRMSWLSRYLMERTDFLSIAETRRRNWQMLDRLLRETELTGRLLHPVVKCLRSGEVPLGYPVKVNHGLRDELKIFLQRSNVFCPVHWPMDELRERSGLAPDLALSRAILTVPIDQRVDEQALEYVADRIRQFSATV